MKTIIHVNQHIIKANAKTGARDPVLTVKTYKENLYAHAVEILGPSRLVYSPDKPLSCGAKVWIETESKVLVIAHPDDTGGTVIEACPAFPVTPTGPMKHWNRTGNPPVGWR